MEYVKNKSTGKLDFIEKYEGQTGMEKLTPYFGICTFKLQELFINYEKDENKRKLYN